MTAAWLAALKVLVLAGGGEPEGNHHSHLVHVYALTDLLAERGLPAEDVAIFWADGQAKGVDRSVDPGGRPPNDWLIRGTRLDEATDPRTELHDTEFPNREVRPAKRAELQKWLKAVGPTLGADDTLLIAVTDHGEGDPQGGFNTRITLWGESWTVEQFSEDLQPVPESTRVVLWMSQCYSGGFAEIHRKRENACGAFSANPDRVAYGCFPQLAGRTDVGHFLRMVEALRETGTLAEANDRVMLSDDTPDTPHLTSDALLYEALNERAERLGARLQALVDARMVEAPEDAEARQLAARIALRYGLGALRNYSATNAVLDEIERARYVADAWRQSWFVVLDAARKQLAEAWPGRVREHPKRPQRLALRKKIVEQLEKALAQPPGLRERVEAMYRRHDRAEALDDRLGLQDAAAVRVAYLQARLAASALDASARTRYAALRACEEAPLLPMPEALAAVAEPPPPAPLPPLGQVRVEIEALRPGYVGVEYRDARDGRGAIVERIMPGSPAEAAGLRAGDRIVAVDGWTLTRPGGFRESVALAAPGERVPFRVERAGETFTAPLIIAPLPLPPPPPAIGEAVPDPRLEAFDPQQKLPGLALGRPVVLFFWATWCKACKKSMPALAEWARSHDAAVIAITREDRATVAKFLEKSGPFPFPIALDRELEATRLFNVEALPLYVLVDGQGTLADEGEGFEGEIPLKDPQARAAAPAP